jgi:hypothetical protein
LHGASVSQGATHRHVSPPTATCRRSPQPNATHRCPPQHKKSCPRHQSSALPTVRHPLPIRYPIGTPLSFYLVLRQHRDEIVARKERAGGLKLDTIGWIFRAYAPEYWWLAIVDLIRRLLLSSVLLAFQKISHQILVALVISLLFVTIYREIGPYCELERDWSGPIATTDHSLLFPSSAPTSNLPPLPPALTPRHPTLGRGRFERRGFLSLRVRDSWSRSRISVGFQHGRRPNVTEPPNPTPLATPYPLPNLLPPRQTQTDSSGGRSSSAFWLSSSWISRGSTAPKPSTRERS